MAKEKTGLKPSLLVIAAGFVTAFLVLLIFGQEFFTEVACFFPPALITLMKMSNNTIDYSKWMTYWLIFNLFLVLESVTDYLKEWIPMYYWLKMMFLFWCFHSSTEGAKHIYSNVLLKFVDGGDVDEGDEGEQVSGGQYVEVDEPDEQEPLVEKEI
eukprot:CAMPEP_0184483016 /NCGR_PEP_ID=MMETSP0113_2-20130426/4636_1 /TAXON_ID=91329 /ORGANISM="Norrisiella sphaerica, Strain BC52" /LENGTH=155 /DNA_ID=CAMNT_0026863141 /DNA_START=114 /DNA_END=581 /DNA_ORIENTATION=+